jgi:aspartate carbamoyltransferase catalytic subunit
VDPNVWTENRVDFVLSLESLLVAFVPAVPYLKQIVTKRVEKKGKFHKLFMSLNTYPIGYLMNPFYHRHVINLKEFTREDILYLLHVAGQMKAKPPIGHLQGKILASCFFEPSTRTRLSFESAMHRLGGQVIGFSESLSTSAAKGESLQDSLKIISHYADVLVIRHPYEGSAQLAAEIAPIPIINAGDGANQHPTQTFLDLFTIMECQGKLDNLQIAMAGDLKYGRTVHSLAQGLIPFKPRLYFISPPGLEMPKEICNELKETGIKFSFHKGFDEVIQKTDILYMTRIQEERFPHKLEYELAKNAYIFRLDYLKDVKPNLKILHPLPRVFEIESSVDESPHAHYFQQAQNGLVVRKALLSLILSQH